MAKVIKKNARVLVVGLGNEEILCDALGKFVTEKLDSKLLGNKLFSFCPGVLVRTGIDSFDIVKLIVKEYKIDAVILVDSLVTENACEFSQKNIQTYVQMNDCGITPGSGAHNLGKEMSKETLGVPCFGIGVPLIIKIGNKLFAPKDVHEVADKFAKMIAKAINIVVL